jgi:hypothetical protein
MQNKLSIKIPRPLAAGRFIADELGSVSIDYFEPNIQCHIVSQLDSQMQVLEGLRKMKEEAEKKIEKY